MEEKFFTELVEFLAIVPAIKGTIGTGSNEDGSWWVKFQIDIEHQLSWQTVQELGHILNYLSLDERLPTSFHPVSPPPYMNGGPKYFLSWVIEGQESEFKPIDCAKWLKGRLPNPVEDLEEWESD